MTPEAILEHPNPLALGADFEGCCPCGVIVGDGFTVETHCWRTNHGCGCKYSGVHVSGTLPEAVLQKIARHVRNNNGWRDATEWAVTVRRL